MKIKTIIMTMCFFMYAGNSVAVTDEINNINDLYQGINKLIQKSKLKKELIYLDSTEKKDVAWEKVNNSATERQFKKSIIKNEIFIHNKKIIKVIQITQSISGDWEDIREHYFRDDGRTAYIFQKLITFQAYDTSSEKALPPGPYILERKIYFDKKGETIKLDSRAYVSLTKKAIPVNAINQIDLEDYKSTQALPFFKILNQ